MQSSPRIVTIPAAILFGYKAISEPRLSAIPVPDAPSDWSGVYPQLTLNQALAYLPNQWDRGFPEASIISLHTRREMQVLYCDDPALKEPLLPSTEKARIIRDAAKKLLPNLSDRLPLLTALGELKTCLCIWDVETFELVVPHALFIEEYLGATEVLRASHKGFMTNWIRSGLFETKNLQLLHGDTIDLANAIQKVEPRLTDCQDMIRLIFI